MSAKWQRRSQTSVWKRRRSPRLSLHEWIRSVAWPWGESEELALWLQFFRWFPALLAVGGVVLSLWGWRLHGLQHDASWGPMQKRLWAEVCDAGDLEVAQHGDVCLDNIFYCCHNDTRLFRSLSTLTVYAAKRIVLWCPCYQCFTLPGKLFGVYDRS